MTVYWGTGAEVDLNSIFYYNESKEIKGDMPGSQAEEIDHEIREFSRALNVKDGQRSSRWFGLRAEAPYG